MKAHKAAALGVLTAMSLAMFIVEAQLPPLLPALPGIKLGLANTVTLYILHNRRYRAADAVLVVIARVLLAALIAGSLFTLTFSLAGGLAAAGTMLIFRWLFARTLIPVTSVAGALTHNAAQVAVAVLAYNVSGFLLYLPALVLSGIVSGLLTGFTVVLINKRIAR